jgi:hypothetical protein
MRLCHYTCKTQNTAADGTYTFTEAEAFNHTLAAVILGNEDVAVPHAIVELSDMEVLDLTAPMVLPGWDTKDDLAAARTISGGDLSIDADPDAMSFGAYSPSFEPYVAIKRMDPAAVGLPWDTLPGAPVALWYLGTFDVTVSPAWPFTVNDDLGLPVGTTLQIWSTSNEDKVWIQTGTATVQEGGLIRSDDGSGLTKLTTMVLVAE